MNERNLRCVRTSCEYRGLMALQMMWTSRSIPPSVIPSWALFYATPIAGSPLDVTVSPREDASPCTRTYETGLDGELAEEREQRSEQVRYPLRVACDQPELFLLDCRN